MKVSRLLPIVLLGLLPACTPGAAPSAADGGPGVRELWSISVRESDTLYLGRPGEFAVDPDDGSFYLTDRFSGRVVRVDRAGRPTRTYGRKGRGPGEFTEIGLPFVADGMLLVLDAQRRTLMGFDRSTGDFAGSWPLGGILAHAVPTPAGVWMGMLDSERRTGAARWTVADGEVAHFAGFPSAYARSQPLAGIYNAVHVDAWADSVAVAFQASDEVVVHGGDGVTADTVLVPAVRRRGIPSDIAERFERIEFSEMFRAASFLFALKRLEGGGFAAVHYDQSIDGRAITSVPYLSISSPDRLSWCVDGELPLSPDAQPRILFRGDTLFTLDQTVGEEGAVTRISAFEIDTSPCRWTPTPSRRP